MELDLTRLDEAFAWLALLVFWLVLLVGGGVVFWFARAVCDWYERLGDWRAEAREERHER